MSTVARRGPGSNQHADKPARTAPTPPPTQTAAGAAAAAADAAPFDAAARLTTYVTVVDRCVLDDGCELEAEPDRYALIETSETTGLAWLSTHKSPQDAEHYNRNQEYAEDWWVDAIIDLDDRQIVTQTAGGVPPGFEDALADVR